MLKIVCVKVNLSDVIGDNSKLPFTSPSQWKAEEHDYQSLTVPIST